VLEAERDDLAKTLEFLSKALIDVRRLIKDNRTTLRNNVDNLQRLAKVLARHNEDIEHTLIDAPVALGDLGLAGGSAKTGTLDARADIAKLLLDLLGNPANLVETLCNILVSPIGNPGELCPDLAEILEPLGGLAAKSEAAAPDDAAAGGAETAPSSEETIKELQGLLGVKP
jgi:ABC-type transporter Mla subunit MlaD